MKLKLTDEFRSSLLTIAASVICGALAGSISGSIFAQLPQKTVEISSNYATSTSGTSASSTSSEKPDVKIVDIQPSSPQQIVPPAFVNRSPAAGILYRASGKQQSLLRRSDIISQAVALTSDGWFAVPLVAVKGTKLADMVLWKDGSAIHPNKGIIDTSASIVFLKADMTNGSTPAFARYTDIARGMAVWVERQPGSYSPMTVAALGEDIGSLNGVSSETSQRRIVLSGTASEEDIGAPVWSSDGALLGVIDVNSGTVRIIPASAWVPSLFSVFTAGNIIHPLLGVHSVDISHAPLLNPPEGLPTRGAWIVGNADTKQPAIDANSPAASAGLKEGDVIQLVDRDILDGRADLGETLVQYKPGSQVTLSVIRAGKSIEVPVTLGSITVSQELK